MPNLVLAHEQGYFDAAAIDNPLLHLWSLGVEEQFYLLWPLALMLFVPRVRNRTTVLVIAVIILLSLALNIVMARRRRPRASIFRSRASGSCSRARCWRPSRLRGTGQSQHRAESRAARAVAEPFHVIRRPGAHRRRHPRRQDALSQPALALPVTLGAALFIGAGPDALPNRTLFSWRPVVYVGLISYPLYLWHWPPLSFLHVMDLNEGTTGRLLRIGAVVFAALAAVLTYHLVEVPIRRRKDLRRLGVRLLGGLSVAAVAGVVVAATGGLPQRTSIDHNPFNRKAAVRREDRCSRIYGQPESLYKNAFCVRNDYAHEPEIVIMGDSHSHMLFGAIQDAYPEVSMLQIGASACPYLRNTEFWNDNREWWRQTCPPLTEAAYRGIGPATRLVILAARMTIYTASPEEYAATFDFDSPKYFQSPDFPGADPAETYRRALARDLRLLLSGGHEVVLVLPVPALDFSPRSCVRLRPVEKWRDPPDADACSLPRATVEARHATARAIVADVAREIADPDLHVVDPMDALCDARRCHAVINGYLMYRDDHHLTVEGANYVWSERRSRGNLGRRTYGSRPMRAPEVKQVVGYLSSQWKRCISRCSSGVNSSAVIAMNTSPA